MDQDNGENKKNYITKKKDTSNKDVRPIINSIDYYIGNLVKRKNEIIKIRQYYEGYRDNKDYAFIEDNKGISNPVDLKFTPLLKSRIDILVGLMLSQNLNPQVTAIDKDTITEEENQRLLKVKEAGIRFNKYLKDNGNTPETKKYFEKITKELKDTDFISSFQEATQHIVNLYLNNTEINYDRFEEELFKNLLLYSETYYREVPIVKNEYPMLDICLPEDFYIMKDKNSIDVNKAKAVVYRRYMTKQQVLIELGRYMNKYQKKKFLEDQTISVASSKELMSRATYINQTTYDGPGLYFDQEYDEYQRYMGNIVEVLHVEYKETKEISIEPDNYIDGLMNDLLHRKKEKKMIEVRKSGYKIGGFYYINVGEDADAKRNVLNPSKVEFSYHGITYNEWGKKPGSIGYSLLDINDKMDIMKYMRDNLVANSGVNGSRINVAAIPSFLGDEMMERLESFLAYSKQGLQLIDPTQAGARQGDFNQYGDFNNTVDGNALSAIGAILQNLEYDADSAAGINAQMRGIMEEREAVSNVKTGITMISYATKKYFTALDHQISKSLTVLLDNVKLSFPTGITGSYYKGANKVYFNMLPAEYVPSKMIVSIKRDDTDVLELQRLKGLAQELGLNGFMDPVNVIEANVADSVQALTAATIKGVTKQKDDAMKQMQQKMEEDAKKIEEMGKNIKDVSSKLETATRKNLELEDKKVQIKEKEVDAVISLEQEKLIAQKEKDAEDTKSIRERTKLEREQLYLSSNAKEVKNLTI